MITIELTKCPDPLKIGEYPFHKNQIYIGSNISADLYINDPNVYFNHFFIEIVENKLLLHPHQSSDYFLIDGKRTTSMRYLKAGQKVGLNSIEFTIKSFSETLVQTFRDTLNTNTDQLINENSQLINFISKIEEQLRDDQK